MERGRGEIKIGIDRTFSINLIIQHCQYLTGKTTQKNARFSIYRTIRHPRKNPLLQPRQIPNSLHPSIFPCNLDFFTPLSIYGEGQG